MEPSPVWRYLSLAKYIDLLRTKSLFFPKASLFADEDEGKWIAHAMLYESRERWVRAAAHADTLEQLLACAGDDPASVVTEVIRLRSSAGEWIDDHLRDILNYFAYGFPPKPKEYLENLITSWRDHYRKHDQDVSKRARENYVYRESTYISCWNRAPSTSLAMWELYGGKEAVAVRSTTNKLEDLLVTNAEMFAENDLEGMLIGVDYIDDLQHPDVAVRERIFDIMERLPNGRASQFAIKSSLYAFEQEVRALVYPKLRDIFKAVEDPHPETDGFYLAVGSSVERREPSVSAFVDAVYLHPGNSPVMPRF